MRSRTTVGAIVGLLREWCGVELDDGAGFSSSGVPRLLTELARTSDQLPYTVRKDLRCCGDIRDSGQVVVGDNGSIAYLVRAGQHNPVVQQVWRDEALDLQVGLDQFVLFQLMNALRMGSPVCATLRFADEGSTNRFLAQLDHYGDQVNVLVGQVVCRFFAADDALVMHLPRAVTGERALVFGRTRNDVEDVLRTSGGVWEWDWLDAIYEPETDQARVGRQTIVVVPSARSGEPIAEILMGRTPTDAITRFLQSWHGLTLPPARRSDEPPLLHRLRSLNRITPIFGAHNFLLDGDSDIDD